MIPLNQSVRRLNLFLHLRPAPDARRVFASFANGLEHLLSGAAPRVRLPLDMKNGRHS
ncbi:hypothetical protein HDIA_1338 [Hartmannibacter diazotrophicus]|uniref:Uncharacterized protein n=1 Tax=Hartmannibacter diazotrophicus TaxID=1482074 RepID=A0A2C9D3X1_9HYPH|nr:hypothetical protein [Hartmannibacter diazotrophicus]SON54879.1 hypothetical protein HDIA_1338 [Hartmannibacter diazotrophicus]